MKKTKIICSIGPASDNFETLRELALAGMDCVRINMSHASYESVLDNIDVIRMTRAATSKHIAIMYDTKGPEFRTLEFENGGINIQTGQTIMMVKEKILGNNERFSVNHPEAIDNIKLNDHVLVDNALLDLLVIDKQSDYVVLKALNDGEIKNHKTLNVPGVNLDLPFMSETDRKDIEFASSHSCDYLALSFVNCANDVREAREIIENSGGDARIIAKIESKTGVDNVDEIINAADGIMVARGDLGVEIPVEHLPLIQKKIIKRCRELGKFAIVATEMLASMSENPRPTRAEVSDIANAVIDGTDCVMLSGETAVGKYPIQAVDYMAKICCSVEDTIDYSKDIEYKGILGTSDTIAKLVADAVLTDDIKAVVATTMTGYTARKISNLRPNAPILACCPSNHIAEKVALNYGVLPVVIKMFDNTDEMIHGAKQIAIETLNLTRGDKIVITGGFPLGQTRATNYIRIAEI